MLDLGLNNKVILDNILDCAIQELDILFSTVNTELIGNSGYGTNFQQFLWELTPSPEELQRYIERKLIDTYFLNRVEHTLNVDYMNSNVGIVYTVNITLYYNEKTIEKNYMLK